MSTLQRRIAREFCVRQTRSAEIELIGTNCVGREKIVRARRADNVVLIDTIAADSDRADEHAVAIKWKTTWENCNAVGQIESDAVPKWRRTKICRGREREVGFGPGKPGKFVLFGEKRPRVVGVDSGRIKFLRQKPDAARGHGDIQTKPKEVVTRIKKGGARFLHCDVPAK